MEELDILKTEKAELEKSKVALEEKVASLEPKVTELEGKLAEAEKVKTDLEAKLKVFEDEKKAAFEKSVEDKVKAHLEKGEILPAEEESIKKVLLEGGDAAETLSKTLAGRKAVDLEQKTKTVSKKPKEEMTLEKAQSEAERINKGK